MSASLKGVRIIGVDVAAIEKTENQRSFRQLMVDNM